MLTGKIEKFKSLSQFKSLKEFNNNIEKWMCDYKSEFTKGEMIAFNRLKRYAAKVYGVANVSINKLSEASKELDGAGVSRSTIKRMLIKAKKLGIITVHETERNDKSQSSNVYVFNIYKVVSVLSTIEPPSEQVEEREHATEQDLIEKQLNHHKTKQIIKTNKIIDIRKDNVIKGIPIEFQNWIKTYGYSGKQVVEFWKSVTYSTKYLNYYNEDAKIQLGIKAFKQMIINLKLGYKPKKSVYAYYHGVLNGILDAEYAEIVREA